MSRREDHGAERQTGFSRLASWLKLIIISIPLAIIGFLQGPSAFEDIHHRACGWTGNWNRIAEWIEPCLKAVPNSAVASPTLPETREATKPTRPEGFEKPVELSATYPGEIWRAARSEEIAWMEGEWCFQTVSLRAKMVVREGLVERAAVSSIVDQDASSFEGKVITRYAAFVSNRGVFRLKDTAGKGSAIFYQHNEQDPRALYEFTRSLSDDGSVRTGKKYQALDCHKCRVQDGIYSCD